VNEINAYLGANEVTVRFEFEPACYGHGAHPDYEAHLFITEVCIGGVWIGAEYIDPDWRYREEISILARKPGNVAKRHGWKGATRERP
jgi:hypothetical protein